jgi:uncharacterized heparinase superfamily protein
MMRNISKFENLNNYLYTRKHFSCNQVIGAIENYFKKVYYNTPIYDFIEYDDYIPSNLNITPRDCIDGDAIRGKQIVNGTITFSNQTLDIGNNINWRSPLVDMAFLKQLHGFDYLKDLEAISRNQGRPTAIRMVRAWMDEEAFVDSNFWQPTILSRRLVNLITHANWMFKECDAGFKKDLMAVILKQSKHLSKTIPWHKNNYDVIASIKGIIYAGLALPQNQSAFLEGLDVLKDELNKQILEDSTHIQKNPYEQYHLLKDLVEIKSIMQIANQQVPAIISQSISSMAESLAFFRHTDGKLAMFNSSYIGDSENISQLLKICNQSFQTDFLPRAGFRKLTRKDTSIILDCGEFAQPGIINSSTASTLAFELAYKKSRIFVNSGKFKDDKNDYRETRFFNAIEVDDHSSSSILKFGLTGQHVNKVESFFQEEKTLGIGFEGSFYGFKNKQVKHTRRIFLAENGDEIRGEDSILNAQDNVRAYFHLHPSYDVKILDSYSADILHNGNKVAEIKVAGGIIRKKQTPFAENMGENRTKNTIILSSKVNKKETILRWAISFVD